VSRAGQTVLVILVALAVALATLLETPDAKRDAPTIDVVAQAGDVVISNSKDGLPIVSMANMKPGDTSSGEVTLQNTGTARGYFYLAPQNLVSPPGPSGESLAEHLILRVSLTKNGVTSKKYGGRLSNMGTRTAGNFRPGDIGTYTFEAIAEDTGVPAPPTLSRPVRGDNKYQGTSASVTFGWSSTP
jgi:spore coat-associated protein N